MADSGWTKDPPLSGWKKETREQAKDRDDAMQRHAENPRIDALGENYLVSGSLRRNLPKRGEPIKTDYHAERARERQNKRREEKRNRAATVRDAPDVAAGKSSIWLDAPKVTVDLNNSDDWSALDDPSKRPDKYLSFGRSFLQGLNDVDGLMGGFQEWLGEATGSKNLTETGRKARVFNNAAAEAYGQGAGVSDIKGPVDALRWAGQTVGRMVPVIVPGVVGSVAGVAAAPAAGLSATVGGLVGAFVGGEAINIGDIQSQMKSMDPNASAPGWVFLGGTAAAALDSIVPGRITGKLEKVFGKEAAKEIALRAMLRPPSAKMLANIAKATTKEGLKDAFVEGLTESAQTAIGEVTASFGAGKRPNYENLPKNMLEAGAAGVLMGGLGGGFTGAMEGRAQNRQARANYEQNVRGEAPQAMDPNGVDMGQTAPTASAVPVVDPRTGRPSPVAPAATPQAAPIVQTPPRAPLTEPVITAGDEASALDTGLIAEGKAKIANLLGSDPFAETPGLAPLADVPVEAPFAAPVAAKRTVNFNQKTALGFIVDDLEGGAKVTTDSGGLTKFGISAKAHPGLDIASLTRDQAMAIYEREYAAPLGLDKLDGPAALVALDAAINHGPAFAKRIISDSGGDAGKMLGLRRAEYARLITQDPGKYGQYQKGWENRLQRLEGQSGVQGEAVAPGATDNYDPLEILGPNMGFSDDKETAQGMLDRVLGDEVTTPKPGQRVDVTQNGETIPGTVESVWKRGDTDGVRIKRDDGTTFDESFADAKEYGARITAEVAPGSPRAFTPERAPNAPEGRIDTPTPAPSPAPQSLKGEPTIQPDMLGGPDVTADQLTAQKIAPDVVKALDAEELTRPEVDDAVDYVLRAQTGGDKIGARKDLAGVIGQKISSHGEAVAIANEIKRLLTPPPASQPDNAPRDGIKTVAKGEGTPLADAISETDPALDWDSSDRHERDALLKKIRMSKAEDRLRTIDKPFGELTPALQEMVSTHLRNGYETKAREARNAATIQAAKDSGRLEIIDTRKPAKTASAAPKQQVRHLGRDDNRYAVETGAVLTTKSGREMIPAPKWDDSTKLKERMSLSRQRDWLLDEARKEARTQNSYEAPMLDRLDSKNLAPVDWALINDTLFGDEYGPLQQSEANTPARATAQAERAVTEQEYNALSTEERGRMMEAAGVNAGLIALGPRRNGGTRFADLSETIQTLLNTYRTTGKHEQLLRQAKAEAAPAVKAPTTDWQDFGPETGTLGIPRSQMPQVKLVDRPELLQFLADRGITHTADTVPADSLKPSQKEWAQSKADTWDAGNLRLEERRIIVSSDGHVIDGHHQWMKAKQRGEDVAIWRMSAPALELLSDIRSFPKAGTGEGAPELSDSEKEARAKIALLRVQFPEKIDATLEAADALRLSAEPHQEALADWAEGTEWSDLFSNPGIKGRARIAEKVLREDYASPAALKDVVRGAFFVETQEQADAIAAAISARFEIKQDKGMKAVPGGYFDHKLIVLFPGGVMGEIQVVPASIWAAKKGGVDNIYDKYRVIPGFDSDNPPAEAVELEYQMMEAYRNAVRGGSFESAFNDAMAALASGNERVNSLMERLDPTFSTRPPAAPQDPASNTNAKGRPSDNPLATGRSSISRNQSSSTTGDVGTGGGLRNPLPAGYGSKNTIITTEAAAEIRDQLRAKIIEAQRRTNAGIDPDIFTMGGKLAIYHIEAGARKFADFVKAISADLGLTPSELKGYLRSWYTGAHAMLEDMGQDVSDMDAPGAVRAAVAMIEDSVIQPDSGNVATEETTNAGASATQSANADDRNSDAGPGSGDVRGPEEQAGGTAQGTDAAGGTGGRNVQRDVQPEPDGVLESQPQSDTAANDSGSGGRAGQGRGGRNRTGGRVRAKPAGSGTNYSAAAGSLKRKGGWKETASRNLDVVELVNRLDAENRFATPEEQKLLASFTGWGAGEIRNNLFRNIGRNSDGTREIRTNAFGGNDWNPLIERAQKLLKGEDLETALQSTQYAHYTSEDVIRSIWDGVTRLGFEGGRILEPGMGNGLFAVAAPKGVMDNSHYTGIEFDKFTAKVAHYLLPQEAALAQDYTKTKLPDGFFDVAIGNPPFSDTKVMSDPAYRKHRFSLHDYFFAKSIDKVRPGGLMVFVTSRYTMDKLNPKSRQYIADRADLLAAVRLPQTAFKENAGTEVVTDVLFFQRRAPGAEPGGQAWLKTDNVNTKNAAGQTIKHMVNEYYKANPKMVLGKHASTGSMYRSDEYTVEPLAAPIEKLFAKAIETIPENVYFDAPKEAKAQAVAKTIERDFAPASSKEGGLYVKDGNLMVVSDGTGIGLPGKISPVEEAWLKSYVPIRDALKQAQRDQLQDGDWEKSHKALVKLYEAHVATHGRIKEFTTYERKVAEEADPGDEGAYQDKKGKWVVDTTREYRRYKWEKLLRHDVEGVLVEALEKITDGGDIQVGAFLKGRTLKKPTRPVIESAQDALAVTLDEIGRVDLAYAANLLGKTPTEIADALDTGIFEAPDGTWQTSDEYLSGKVLDKLDEARTAANVDPRFERNVQALLAVQPKPLSYADITVKLGAGWVPVDVVQAFADEVLEAGTIPIAYNVAKAEWTIEGSGARWRRSNTDDYGTERRSPVELLDAILNNRTIKIVDKTPDGKTVTNAVDTEAAQAAARKMEEKFKSWVWTDAKRAERLSEIYNTAFNNIAPRSFNGDHLTFPGLSSRFASNTHPHVKRAVWRQIQTGNTYLAHAVGAGKTREMIIGGMEQRRLGLIKKPMYVVPNHMLNQFAYEFLEAYPAANIMVADEQQFHTDNRKRFMAQVSLNDPDAIIVTHSSFKKINTGAEARGLIVNNMIVELEEAMEGADTRQSRSKIENQIEKLKQNFDAKTASDTKDQALTFEEMGVDFLYIDEGHEFRKLDFATSRTAKGIDAAGSQKSMDLFIKSNWLETQNPGRSMVMASGTPITNTMAELFTVMRFLDRKALEADGIAHFDAWANMFGEMSSQLEKNAVGNYEMVERFAKFVNVADLMRRVRSFMDVLTGDQLGDLVQRPEIKTRKPIDVVTPPVEALREYMAGPLNDRLVATKAWKPSPGQPSNPDPVIAINGDALLSSIDMRFIDPSLPSDPESKLNKMIDGIIEKHKEFGDVEYVNPATGKKEPRKGAGQIVFSPVGFGDQVAKNRGFSAKEWINRQLVAGGVKATEIGWMQDANTHAKKEQLQKDVRSGKVRVLLGSPKNMGTGLNVQTRLKALHYLSPPWFPSDVEQPHGRIERQGNLNPQVEIYWYATKETYEAAAWGMVARKARFIQQALAGDDSIRVLDDISAVSQYEMAAALAAGDDRVIKIAGLGQEVERFQRLRSAHAVSQRQMQQDQRFLEKFIPKQEGEVAKVQAALDAKGTGYEPFSITVDGTRFDKQGEAGTAMLNAIDKAILSSVSVGTKEIGKYLGKFPVTMRPAKLTGKAFSVGVTVGPMEFEIIPAAGSTEGIDARGLSARVENTFSKIRGELQVAKERLAESVKEQAAIARKIGAPFENEAALAEKIAERAQIEEQLAAEGQAKEAASKTTMQDKAAENLAAREDGPSLQAAPLTVYHGGTYNPNVGPNTPFFVSENAEFSEAYAKERGRGRGRLMQFQFTPRKTANEAQIIEAARKVFGDEVDQMPTYSMLDPNVENDATQVIAALEADGYDSAAFEDHQINSDFDMLPVFAVFDPSALGRGGYANDTSYQAAETLAALEGRDEELIAALLAQLAQFGIADKVSLEVARKLTLASGTAAGQYYRRVISMALEKSNDPGATLAHEAVHALRAMGLFTPAEWNSLEAAAWANPAARKFADRPIYAGLSLEKRKEEAAAEYFAESWRTFTPQGKGLWARAALRIFKFAEAVIRTVNKVLGRPNTPALDAARVRDKIMSGEIGRRAVGQSDSAGTGPQFREAAFDNEETERRWTEAKKGIGDGPNLIDKAGEWWEDVKNGFTRHWRDLPNEPRFADLQQQFRKLEAAPDAAMTNSVSHLRELVGKMNAEEYDLFSRKVVLDDLAWESASDHALPFGLTPTTLKVERQKIDALVADSDKLIEAVRLRKSFNKNLADDMVAAGVLTREQIKNPSYFRHMVLDYARHEAALAQSPSSKLKSPYWAKRMGSTLDINANLMEAELDWLQKAQVDVVTAKTLDWVKDSKHNIREQLRAQAKDRNATIIAEMIAADPSLGKEEAQFRQMIGRGFQIIKQELRNGDRTPSHLQDAADDLESNVKDGETPYALMAWMLDTNQPGAMGAGMVLKYGGLRKAWMKQHLGEDYLNPDDIAGLVKRLKPDGYSAWQPIEGRHLFTAKTMSEHALDMFIGKLADTSYPGVDRIELEKALAQIRAQLVVGGDRYTMVLPNEVTATLNEYGDRRAEGMAARAFGTIQGGWKIWQLINPRRFLKYNINNTSGDLDAIIAGNPGTLRHLGRAWADLREASKGNPSARYTEAIERGVFNAGLSIQEIPDINRLSGLRHLAEDRGIGNKLTIGAVATVWRALKDTTQFRENLFRLAAYIDYADKIEKGVPQLEIGYGASVPNMVDAVADGKDRAALLARDLIGDYGSISVVGAILRKFFIPFWSWTEINTRRYWRLTNNAFAISKARGLATGGALGAGIAARTAIGLTIRMGMLYGLASLWNNLLFGDDEDKLGKQQQRQLHLILGHNSDGEVITMRFQGAMSDVFSMLGFPDAVAGIKDYMNGQGSIGQSAMNVAKAPVNRVLTATTPLASVPLQLIQGREWWPDFFNPRQMHDPKRFVARTFTLENEYDLIAGKPSRGYGRSWQESLLYRRDPGEMAFDDAKSIAYKWLHDVKGLEGGGQTTPRGEALREYRMGLRYGDQKAADAALVRYAEFGGTDKDLGTSIKRQHPLGPIAKKDRETFLDSLTPEQLDTFANAEEWYRSVFLDAND